MASQIVTRVVIVLALCFSASSAYAEALNTVEINDIIAQLKAMYEVEGNSSARCEHLVNKRPHYKKVLGLLDERKRNLTEETRTMASLGFFTVFSGPAEEVNSEQLKKLVDAEDKYGCKTYRTNMNLIPSHGSSFEP